MLVRRLRVLPRLVQHRFFTTNKTINTKSTYEIDRFGRADGLFTERYENGRVKTECYFSEDRLDGSYVTKHENGVIRSHKNYLLGKLHGKCTEYDPNGRTQEECNYDRGRRVGLCTEIRNDGHTHIINYKNDLKHGEYKEYDIESVLILKCNYKKDKLHGKYKSWYNNGKKRRIANYIHGELDATLREYRSNGDPEIQATYLNGRLHGTYIEWSKHDPFNPIHEIIYQNGKAIKVITMRRDNDLRNHVLLDGDIIVWKACCAGAIRVYVKLFVPANAKRVSVINSGGQSRVESALVLEIFDKEGNKYDKAESMIYRLEYRVGEVVKPDIFDNNIGEMTNGIYVYKYLDCCDDQ